LATRIQHRRATAEEWNTLNPVLAEGEIGVSTYFQDSEFKTEIRIGNGELTWSELSPISGPEGPIGPTGPLGPTGPEVTGPTGPTGPTGGFNTSLYDLSQQSTNSYTISLSDLGSIITLSNTDPISLIVPTNSAVPFEIGTIISAVQADVGKVTISGPGVTINATPGLFFREQWSAVSLIKIDTDTWLAIGDLSNS
jgi:hypothetical protein